MSKSTANKMRVVSNEIGVCAGGSVFYTFFFGTSSTTLHNRCGVLSHDDVSVMTSDGVCGRPADYNTAFAAARCRYGS